MSEKKETPEKESKAIQKKKQNQIEEAKKKSTIMSADNFPETFNEAFERLRKDFESILVPSSKALERALSAMPKTRIPLVDLEDRGKDFLLKAEMPGFKKEDVEIQVFDDAIEISGMTGWKYDSKNNRYICKERACESFYRMVQLPEEIKIENVEADLKDGVLEIKAEKKAPKQARKIQVK